MVSDKQKTLLTFGKQGLEKLVFWFFYYLLTSGWRKLVLGSIPQDPNSGMP